MAFDIALRDSGGGFSISLADTLVTTYSSIGRRGSRPRNRYKLVTIITGGGPLVGDFLVDQAGNLIVDQAGDYLTWD